jgi:hypothetical protein
VLTANNELHISNKKHLKKRPRFTALSRGSGFSIKLHASRRRKLNLWKTLASRNLIMETKRLALVS